MPLKTTSIKDPSQKSRASSESSEKRTLPTRLGEWLHRWVLLTGQLPTLTRDPAIDAWVVLQRVRY